MNFVSGRLASSVSLGTGNVPLEEKATNIGGSTRKGAAGKLAQIDDLSRAMLSRWGKNQPNRS